MVFMRYICVLHFCGRPLGHLVGAFLENSSHVGTRCCRYLDLIAAHSPVFDYLKIDNKVIS